MQSKLSGQDICNIIKTCKKSYVKEFQIGDLKVSFDWGENPGTDAPERRLRIHKPNFRGSLVEAEKLEDQATLQANADLADEEISNLHISDPDEFEAQLIQGALGNAEENSG